MDIKGKLWAINTQQYVLFSAIFFLTVSSSFASSSVHRDLLKASDRKTNGQYTFAQCKSIQGKPFDKNSTKKKVLIIGDSLACDFINNVMENNFLEDYQVRLRFIPYRCQTVYGKDSVRYITRKDRPYCANSARADTQERSKPQLQEADLVVFTSRWKPEIAKRLPQTIRQLDMDPQKKVVVIGCKYFGKIAIRQYMKMPEDKLRTLQNDVGNESQSINSILSKGLGKGIVFIDPQQLVCTSETSCPVFTPDLQLISYDGRHLTKAGARYVGKLLFQKSELGQM